MSDRLRGAFAASSILLLLVLALVLLRHESQEYRRLQREYRLLARQSGAAERSGIQQIWLPRFGDRVDRCATCHLGVAEPALAGAKPPFGFHPATAHAPADFERLGCVACHGGHGLATSREEAHGSGSLLSSAHVEAACGRCHAETEVAEAPRLTRGRQLMRDLGCFQCHASGPRRDLARAGPPLEGLAQKVSKSWLRRKLVSPRAVDPNARMPEFGLKPAEIDMLADYLFSLDPLPAVQALVRQAALEAPGHAKRGETLFRAARCVSCHTVEGKGNGRAPELSQVGSKVPRGWLLAFMRDTHVLHPQTTMPVYGFSPSELRDLVAYMTEELRDFEATGEPEGRRPAEGAMTEEGRQLFIKYACFTCHGGAEAGREPPGPDLSAVADKKMASLDFGARHDLPRTLPAWLAAKVTQPRSFGSTLKMPAFRLEEEDLAAVVTALLSSSGQDVPAEYRPLGGVAPRWVPPPPSGEVGRLFARYRCLSCHTVGAAGDDLSTVALTFEGSKVKREWLVEYLLLPTTIFPALEERMPILEMTPAEAKRIADYIADVYVDDAIPVETAFRHEDVRRGEQLFGSKGCRACHIVGESGGYLGPPLSEAGDRFRSGWIGHWLEDPQRWRRQARCPNYGLSAAEIRELTAFVATRGASPSPPPVSSGGTSTARAGS